MGGGGDAIVGGDAVATVGLWEEWVLQWRSLGLIDPPRPFDPNDLCKHVK